MNQAQENKMLRRARAMRYFVDATREIMVTQGLSAVNIRNVAAKAGYSSGSIYEYFESIDQLIAFATIDDIYGFLNKAAVHITDETDPLEAYIITWHFFSLHAFKNPDLYERVALIYGTNIVSFLNQYYELFPAERRDFPDQLKGSFFALDKHDRDHSLLLKCVEKGYFHKEDVEDISKMINAEFLGCLKFCSIKQAGFDPRLFIKMIKKVVLGYNPALAPILDVLVLPESSD